MPWKIVKNHQSCPSSKPVAVVKQSDNSVVGCHSSEGKAKAQLAALNIAEDEDRDATMSEPGKVPLDFKDGDGNEVLLSYVRAEVHLGKDEKERKARAHELKNDTTLPIPFVASTEGVKSDGIDLRMEDWDLTRFTRYGPILWVHDYFHPPLGTGAARADDKLMIDVHFDRDDDFAMKIRSKAIKGMMAGSVGWLTKKGGRNELYEFSMTPVGLDPDSLPDIQRMGIRALQAKLTELLKDKDDSDTADYLTLIQGLRDEMQEYIDETLENYQKLDEEEEEDRQEEPVIEEEEREQSDPPDGALYAVAENGTIWRNNVTTTTGTGTGTWHVVTDTAEWPAITRLPGYSESVTWPNLDGYTEGEPADFLSRAGAMLSRKNRDDLEKALELINDVIERATPDSDEDGMFADLTEDDDKRALAEGEDDEANNLRPNILTEIRNILDPVKEIDHE